MKIGVLLAGLVLGAGMMAIPCSGQNPQKIVDEYVRAIGGEKPVAAVRTESIAGSVRVKAEAGAGVADNTTDAPETFGTYSLIVKAPNKFYSEFGTGGERAVIAFNGKSAWQKNGGAAAVTLTGANASEAEAEARYLNGRLVHLKRDKIGARLVGIDDVHAQKAYHIELAFTPSVKRDLYFDTGTRLLVRSVAREIGTGGAPADGTVQTDYFDYRTVNGVLEPQSMEVTRGGKTYTVSVTHVDLTSEVNDAIFNFPSNDKRPLPDIPQLLRDLNSNQRAIEEIQKHYTCHLTVEELKVDSKGDVTSKTVKEYDSYFIGEDEVRRLVAKDGKPLEGDEKRKEEERFSKQFDELKKKQAELANDPKKQEKQQERDDEQISDFLRAESFTNPRRELFRGHEVIVFDFAANPDYKARNLNEAIAQKLGGVVWVDEEARDVARLEARFTDSAKIGGGLVGAISKGTNLVIEQAKVNDEVWLPTYAEVHASARLAFVHFKANEIDRYTDYRKFGSEVRLGSSTLIDAPGAANSAPGATTPATAPPVAPPQNTTPEKPQ